MALGLLNGHSQLSYIYVFDNFNVLHILLCSLASLSTPVYKAINKNVTGTQLVEECQAPGERLARINNNHTLGEVKNVIPGNSQIYWTGLR